MPLASLLGWSKFGAALQPPPLEPRASFPPSGLPRGGGSPPGGPPSRSTRGGEIAPLFPGEREGEGVREGVGGRPKRASRRAGRGGTPQALEEARGGERGGRRTEEGGRRGEGLGGRRLSGREGGAIPKARGQSPREPGGRADGKEARKSGGGGEEGEGRKSPRGERRERRREEKGEGSRAQGPKRTPKPEGQSLEVVHLGATRTPALAPSATPPSATFPASSGPGWGTWSPGPRREEKPGSLKPGKRALPHRPSHAGRARRVSREEFPPSRTALGGFCPGVREGRRKNERNSPLGVFFVWEGAERGWFAKKGIARGKFWTMRGGFRRPGRG